MTDDIIRLDESCIECNTNTFEFNNLLKLCDGYQTVVCTNCGQLYILKITKKEWFNESGPQSKLYYNIYTPNYYYNILIKD
jgi:hypothetical protein